MQNYGEGKAILEISSKEDKNHEKHYRAGVENSKGGVSDFTEERATGKF